MNYLLSILACVFWTFMAHAQESRMELSPNWEFVADTVMGGVSTGRIEMVEIDGRQATRLTGSVSLDNNGGFVQMAFDVNTDGSPIDGSRFTGIEFDVYGSAEAYDLRLRTDQLEKPWHSYRAAFMAKPEWQSIRIPFSAISPHRTDIPFDPASLRRIGILAIGRAFQADVALSGIRLY
ncbi:MAG: CIA30 family protein [Sulfitobacter sp.]